jgi:hypothetical protein
MICFAKTRPNGGDPGPSEIPGILAGMVGVGAGNFTSGEISPVFDNFDLTGVASR